MSKELYIIEKFSSEFADTTSITKILKTLHAKSTDLTTNLEEIGFWKSSFQVLSWIITSAKSPINCDKAQQNTEVSAHMIIKNV